MTFEDPQGTMAQVMRPPKGFESLYQGESADIPILLVPRDDEGEFRAVPRVQNRPELSPNLVRMLQVGRDSTVKLWLPRLWANFNLAAVAGQDYEYQLVWRLRQVRDHNVDGSQFSLADRQGVPDTTGTSPVMRLYIPCAQGPIITPSSIGDDTLPLISLGTSGHLSNGVYDPDTSSGVGARANQATYYPPEILHSRGDEMGILVRRVNRGLGTWDFTTGGRDEPFSNYFGTGGNTHAVYPFLGVRVYTTTALV